MIAKKRSFGNFFDIAIQLIVAIATCRLGKADIPAPGVKSLFL